MIVIDGANHSIGFEMSVGQLLKKKRDGDEFSKDEISYFIKEMVAGRIADSQIGAMLMAIFIKGLSDEETLNLTDCMISSGSRLQWEGTVVDKHSTGGVGDKISIILAPVLAACGLKVPMISGRSLEFTGGTLDKLESIPGFIVDLTEETMVEALDCAGLFIAAATSQICPADKMLYRVRDITSTVDYMNLIVPSIISKKVASGVKFLVLDVKVGEAAFCKSVESGRALGKQLICVGEQLGVRTRVVLSRMDQPLGNMVGNSLEITESVQCLQGNLPSDIARLVTVLASNLLEMTGYQGDAEQQVRRVLADGSALDRFRRMLRVQGVNEEVKRRLTTGSAVLPTAKYTTQFKSTAAGWVSHVDALAIAKMCLSLGAGRLSDSRGVDHAVGVVVDKHIGDSVAEGETWLTVHHSCAALPPAVGKCLQYALVVSATAVCRPDIVIEVIQ